MEKPLIHTAVIESDRGGVTDVLCPARQRWCHVDRVPTASCWDSPRATVLVLHPVRLVPAQPDSLGVITATDITTESHNQVHQISVVLIYPVCRFWGGIWCRDAVTHPSGGSATCRARDSDSRSVLTRSYQHNHDHIHLEKRDDIRQAEII